MRLRASTLLAIVVPLMMSACATIAPPLPPSLDLPKPPTDLRATRKGDRVTLTWTMPSSTTDRQNIRAVGPTQICRSVNSQVDNCGTPVGTLPPTKLESSQPANQKPTASYTDVLPAEIESDNPSAFVTYAVEVLNTEGRSAGLSNHASIPLIRTLPPPRNFEVRVRDRGVVLAWTEEVPTPLPSIHYLFRIYRRGEKDQRAVIGQVAATQGPDYTFTDSEIEWQKTYYYSLEPVTVIAQAGKAELPVEGDSTAEIKVFANDIFPPAVPTGLQAVYSGPGQQPFIDLVWAPVSDPDLAGYNVYRGTEGTAFKKINANLVKTPAYRDANVTAGSRYIYSVTSVDQHGNESAHSEETSEAVPAKQQ